MRITPPGIGPSNRPDITARLDAIESRQQDRGQKIADNIEKQRQLNHTLTSVQHDLGSLLQQIPGAARRGSASPRQSANEPDAAPPDPAVIQQRIALIQKQLLDALKIAS